MTQYVKFINEYYVEKAPNNKGSIINYNKNEELLLKDGYKKLIETEKPLDGTLFSIKYQELPKSIKEIIIPESEEHKKERERYILSKLSLTQREVFLALYKDKGITPESISSQITDVLSKIEFEKAERYYRGNPLIDIIGQELGYTTEQLDYLFLNGHFEGQILDEVE